MSTQITISPVIKLEVNTTPITGGSAGQILFQTTGNTVGESANLFWDATNNRLGIGSSSPSGLVHLFASANTVLLNFARASNNATKAGWFQVDASDNVIYTSTNGALDFKTNWNGGTQLTTMYLNSNGTVGIGTSTLTTGTPLTIQGASNNGLTIRGNSTTDRYKQFIGNGTTYTADEIFLQANNTNLNILGGATGSTNWLTIKGTGNVGINTTTDAGFRLDVNGTARLGASTIQTLTVGLGTGSQSHNTVLGLSAFSSNTSGNFNVAIGPSALFSNTTGTGNIGIGHFSAVQIGAGTNNVAIGREALSNGNSTGNVAIGFQACSTATGTNNIVIGLQSQAGNFNGSIVLGINASATAGNQFVVGSTGTNAGSVTTEVNASTQVWNVIINGVARKILLA